MSPREAPIRAVHVWGSVAVIVVTLVVGILKVGQWSGSAEEQLKSINVTVRTMGDDIKAVAQQSQETRERVIRLEGIVQPDAQRQTPILGNKYTSSVP